LIGEDVLTLTTSNRRSLKLLTRRVCATLHYLFDALLMRREATDDEVVENEEGLKI
jgi:hypothetical protein